MNKPETQKTPTAEAPLPGGRLAASAWAGEGARGWIALVLELHPFPALAAEAGTDRVTFANRAARELQLDAEGAHAVGPQGEKVDARRLVRFLQERAAEADGAEVTWHAPGRASCCYFRVFCRVAPPHDGDRPLAVLTFLDISRQKAVEAELRGAIEARDEFFSVATHELKDPLFSLQLSLQLLGHAAARLGEVPHHVRQHLEVGNRQASRLARLIDNLLDVSRIASGRLRLDVETLDLAELAREVVGRFHEQAGSSGTPLEMLLPGGPVVGYFDRMKLEQVLSNLLSNALKYSAGRPVTVCVREAEEDTAVLEVQDRGAGIAAEDQGRIFERFERASGEHRRESLGLGLYIVRSLVEAHGGAVAVWSKPGLGSRFSVTLPRKRLPSQADHPTDSAGAGGAAT